MNYTKLAGLGLTALKNNFARLDRPYKLTFSITYSCQSRCLTCNIWKMRPTGELDLREIQAFARKNDYFRWIEITGGEPFLRSDIVDIVKAFAESSKSLYVLTMPTNSLCNTDSVARRIEEILAIGIPKVSITISLDGYRELHDRIRGIPGNFDKAMAMARRLKELQSRYPNLFFVFVYTMSKFNQGMLEKTISAVKDELPWAGPDNFHVNVGQMSDIYYANKELDLRPDKDIASGEISWLVRNRGVHIGTIPIIEKAFLKKLIDYVKTGKSPMKGKSMDASLFMDSYGNVYPSIMWGRKVGSIRDTGYDLAPIWKGPDAEGVRKLISEGKEPSAWTACEAYQSIVGNIGSMII